MMEPNATRMVFECRTWGLEHRAPKSVVPGRCVIIGAYCNLPAQFKFCEVSEIVLFSLDTRAIARCLFIAAGDLLY
jgi:hypothetical protein